MFVELTQVTQDNLLDLKGFSTVEAKLIKRKTNSLLIKLTDLHTLSTLLVETGTNGTLSCLVTYMNVCLARLSAGDNLYLQPR